MEPVEIKGDGGLMERWSKLFGMSVGEHDEAGAIEDEFVVRSHLVEVEDRGLEFGRCHGEGVESPLELSAGKGACREVDEEIGGLCIVEWVASVAGCKRGVVACPEVFADGEEESSAAEGNRGERVSGQEVPRLIEDVIGGEEQLVVSGEEASVFDEERCVLKLVRSGRVVKR